MIRVAHVITSLSTGGAESMMAKLLLAMDRGRFASEVICLTRNGPIGDQLEEAGFPVHVLGMRRFWPWPSSLSALLNRFKDFQPEIIQGWMYHGNIATMALRRPACTVWNIRATVSPGLKDERFTTRLMIRSGARRSGQINRILYNSRRSRIAHEAIGFKQDCGMIIPNGFMLDRFRPNPKDRIKFRSEWGISEETTIFGIVGRSHPVKDHPNFLKAARRVLDIGVPVRFVLVGTRMDSTNEDLISLIRDLKMLDSVILLGERHDLHQVTNAFDIAVLSSKSEAFPNVLGEAMSCGVPCVATDVGDSAWLIGDTGVVVPPQNSEALAQGMAKLLHAGTKVRFDMGIRARERIQENFSISAVARTYEALYMQIIKNGSGLR